MRIARWRGNYGIGEGFVVDDRVVPFADGLTVADVRPIRDEVERRVRILLDELVPATPV